MQKDSLCHTPWKIVIEFFLFFKRSTSKTAIEYMKNEKIELYVDIGTGKRNFEAYTMDLTKKYIEINADYRT